MFETNRQKLPNIKNIPLIKSSNYNKIKEIMEPEGFIFLDKNNQEILRLNGEIDKKELVKIINENIDK